MTEELIALKARRIALGAEVACAISAGTLARFLGDAVEALTASARLTYLCAEIARIEARAASLPWPPGPA